MLTLMLSDLQRRNLFALGLLRPSRELEYDAADDIEEDHEAEVAPSAAARDIPRIQTDILEHYEGDFQDMRSTLCNSDYQEWDGTSSYPLDAGLFDCGLFWVIAGRVMEADDIDNDPECRPFVRVFMDEPGARAAFKKLIAVNTAFKEFALDLDVVVDA